MIHIRHSATPSMRRLHRQRMRRSMLAAATLVLLCCMAAFITPRFKEVEQDAHHFQAVHFSPESTPEQPPAHTTTPPSPEPQVIIRHQLKLPDIEKQEEAELEFPHLPDIPSEPDELVLETTPEALAESTPPQPLASPPPPAPAAQAEAPGTYIPPSYQKSPQPPYPPHLRRNRIQGVVGVLISVAADGTPTHVEIAQSSGNPQLDSHTRRWILHHWHFSPAQKNGTPLAAQVRTRVNYALQ